VLPEKFDEKSWPKKVPISAFAPAPEDRELAVAADLLAEARAAHALDAAARGRARRSR
jgi:hypothetical protein